MAEKKDKVAKRPKARREAAATEGGHRVKLLKDPSQMSPEDRVRYFLGLPQGYPMNPVVASKAFARLKRDTGWRADAPSGTSPFSRELTDLEQGLWFDLQDVLEYTEGDEPWGPATDPAAMAPKFSGVTPASAFRYPGEGPAQARKRMASQRTVRQEAAMPPNPRRGGPKRKHGTY